MVRYNSAPTSMAGMDALAKSTSGIRHAKIRHLMSASRTGLSLAEAGQRLASDGPNALPGKTQNSLLALGADILREPMLLLLLGAGMFVMALGDIHDALMLLAFAGLSIVIELVQAAAPIARSRHLENWAHRKPR